MLCLPLFAHAEANAGFVDTAIWFSNEPDVVGETTTISTLINNQDPKAVYGVVGFYDNGNVIAKKPTTVEPHASKVVSTTWKVTEGSHTILVKFEDTRYTNDKGAETIVTNSEAAPYRFNVTADKTATEKTTTDTTVTTATTTAEKTVGQVKGAATSAIGSFDDFRAKTSVGLQEKATQASKEIEQIKTESAKPQSSTATKPTSDSFLKTPFAYLKMIFFKVAYFIFHSAYMFYGLIILIIILFIRYLIRAPR